MSWKAIAGSIFFVLILFAGSNFVTWKITTSQVTKDVQASLTQDSVRVDTLRVPYPDTIYVKGDTIKIKADKEITELGTIFKTNISIPIISKEDTIGIIDEKIIFNPEDETFKIIVEDLIIKPIEKYIPIVTTIYQTIPVEVPADPPFYNTFWFGSVFTIISAVLLAIFL